MKLIAALWRKLRDDIIIGIVIALVMWGMFSYFEIIFKHNDKNPQYSRYNLICMYTNVLENLTNNNK